MKKAKSRSSRTKMAAKKGASKTPSRTSSNDRMPLRWVFYPVMRLSEDRGLKDAGVETFKGNIIENLARESLQNSLDARDPAKRGPVRVEFQLLELHPDQLPDLNGLREVFSQCRKYLGTDKEVQDFMAEALDISSQPIPALRIADFRTTGAQGRDTDLSSSWYKLTRSRGASSKHEGEGGSYGIGAQAQFAASRLRTVLYSTKTATGSESFIGVARLVTHNRKSDGEKADSVGYLGEPGGEHAGGSISEPSRIPKHLRRDSPGTNVVILGFPVDASWEKDLQLSVLDNFWPAILFGDLEVTIGSQTINKSNLESLLQQCSGAEEFTAHLYYECFVSPTHEFEASENVLPILKKASLKLRAGEAGLPKRVAMVRRTGMVIYRQLFQSPTPYCGVFICRHKYGNALLREMEPPRHDAWNPNLPTKGKNRKTEAEFKSYIREQIKGMTVQDESKVVEITEIAHLLPDDEPAAPGSDGKAAKDGTPSEAFPGTHDVKDEPQRFPVKPISPPPIPPVVPMPDDSEPIPNPPQPPGPNPPTPPSSLPVNFRAYPRSDDPSTYSVTVRFVEKPPSRCYLQLRSVGDDAKRVLRIKRAKQSSGKNLQVSSGNQIGPIDCPKTVPLKLEVSLDESRKIAMEVAAHEA